MCTQHWVVLLTCELQRFSWIQHTAWHLGYNAWMELRCWATEWHDQISRCSQAESNYSLHWPDCVTRKRVRAKTQIPCICYQSIQAVRLGRAAFVMFFWSGSQVQKRHISFSALTWSQKESKPITGQYVRGKQDTNWARYGALSLTTRWILILVEIMCFYHCVCCLHFIA